MTPVQKIIKYIDQLKDKDELEKIASAAISRIEELNKHRGELHLELIDGYWYAVEPGQGERKGRQLGKQLTMTETLKQAREKQPTIQDFEVTPEQAKELRKIDPERVGWWHDSTKNNYNTRYYDIPPYQEAAARWKQNNALAHDPVAITYRMSIETIRKLRALEEMGFEIIYPVN